MNKKQFYGSFLWMGFNCPKGTEPPQVNSLVYTTKFREILGTHLIDLGKMKDGEIMEPPSGFKSGVM